MNIQTAKSYADFIDAILPSIANSNDEEFFYSFLLVTNSVQRWIDKSELTRGEAILSLIFAMELNKEFLRSVDYVNEALTNAKDNFVKSGYISEIGLQFLQYCRLSGQTRDKKFPGIPLSSH